MGASELLMPVEEEWEIESSSRTSKGPGVPIRASDVIAIRTAPTS